jgi:hypothetical protein
MRHLLQALYAPWKGRANTKVRGERSEGRGKGKRVEGRRGGKGKKVEGRRGAR